MNARIFFSYEKNPGERLRYFKKSDAKQNVSGKILDQFFHVRNVLCKELSILSTLKEENDNNHEMLYKYRDKISSLYFEYYDFFPKEVLEELNCLFVCLSDRRNRIFLCKGNRIIAITKEELPSFIKRISLVDNFKYSSLLFLNSKNDNLRRTTAVKCQARSVLVSLNEYFTMAHLLDWINVTTKNR